jgi:hypothetical protein
MVIDFTVNTAPPPEVGGGGGVLIVMKSEYNSETFHNLDSNCEVVWPKFNRWGKLGTIRNFTPPSLKYSEC